LLLLYFLGEAKSNLTEGRLIAVALMVSGVGLFATYAGYFASLFLEEKKDDRNENQFTY